MPNEDQWLRAYRTNLIISGAMAASLLVYAIIVEIMKFQDLKLQLIPADFLDKLRFVFVFFAFASYFIIDFCRKKLLTKSAADTAGALLGRLTLTNIISLALAELPALFGLMLFLGSGESKDFYLLLLISVLLFYAFFPRAGFWASFSRGIDPDVPPGPTSP
jgi:hypothetical protein